MKKALFTAITLMLLLAATAYVAQACTALQFSRSGTCLRTTTCTDVTTGQVVGTWAPGQNSGCVAPIYMGHTYRWSDGCFCKDVVWNGGLNVTSWTCSQHCLACRDDAR